MTEETRKITADDRLRLFAVITVAAQHYGDCRKMERAARRILGRDDDGTYLNDCLGDLLYNVDETGKLTEGAFDNALRSAGYTVEQVPPNPAAETGE